MQPKSSFFSIDFHEFYSSRYVLFMLTVRDIKLRYKQTALGALWVILQPLLTALIFAIIFGKGLRVPHAGESYLLFAFAALIPWMIFSQSLQRAGPSITSDARLITKVYFPRIFLPLSATFGVLVDYGIAILLGCGLALHTGLSIHRVLLWLPIATLHLFLFCAAMNVLIAGLNVFFRDLKHIIPFLVQLGMFVSPIAYPLSVIPEKWIGLYQCNPLVGIIELYRFAFLGTPFPKVAWTLSLLITIVLSAGALFSFQKWERNFADVI